ncbi:MAG: PAS domain S-box protein [Magnetococcales bacterium]|nr:PAS domain S-box protein [Magnetococcales bacterium]
MPHSPVDLPVDPAAHGFSATTPVERVIHWEMSWPAGLITQMGSGIQPWTGYPPDSWTTFEVLSGRIQAEDRPRARAMVREHLAQGLDFSFACRLVTANGEVVWTRTVGVLVREGGTTVGLRGFFIDITAEKRTLDALARRENQYRELVENANSIILHMDTMGRVIFFNRFARELFGYRAEEIQGRSVVGTIMPERCLDGREMTQVVSEIIIQPESAIPREYEIINRNGDRLWVSWTMKGIRNHQGMVVEVLGVGHDVTVRRQAEQALRESEERYRRLFEGETDGILVLDAETLTIEDCNPAVELMLGYRRHELLRMQVTRYTDRPESELKQLADCAENLSSGHHIPLCHLRHKNGTVVPVEISAGSFVSGGRKKLIGAYRDISERLKREADLKKFRDLMDQSGDAFLVLDPADGRVLDANGTAWTSLGMRREELFRLRAGQFQTLALGGAQDWDALVQGLRESGSLSVEGLHRRQDGSSFPVEVNLRLAGGDDQETVLASARNITKRKETEAALIRAKESAEEASRLKDKFVSLVAHDLRAPISSIVSLLEFLRDDQDPPLSPTQRDLLSDVLATGRNLNLMIEEILNIGRLKSGKIRLEKSFFDGHFLSEEVIQRLDFISRKKGLQITNQIPEETRLYGDPTLLGEVLFNLMSNAVKFSHPGGRIQLLRLPDDDTALAVVDYGVGIPDEVIPRLFHVEEKVSTPGTLGETGTGFGLPFSFDIVEAHGGSLTVESTPGAGSTFTVRLPPMRPRVLLVDDGAMDRLMIGAFLESLDVEIMEAESGAEALALVDMHLPHLVVTDIAMPAMDGFQLLRELKRRPETEHIPVILITGDEKTETRDRAFRMGAVDFAVKPVVVHDFLPRVRHIIS